MYNSISLSQSKRIERVQSKFEYFINFNNNNNNNNNNFNNNSNNNNISLSPLSNRRCMLDMIFLFKCLNSLFDCYLCSLFPLKVNRLNSRNKDLLLIPFNRVNCTRNGFIHRLALHYNSISQLDTTIDVFRLSLSVFKSKVFNVKFK